MEAGRSETKLIPRSALRQLRQGHGPRWPRRLFFLHIPKCGGTSVDAAISACYSGGRTGGRGRFHLDAVARLKAAQLADVSEGELSQPLLLYLMAHRSVRYISGHFQFSETAYRAFGGEWDFITILRHPVSRWFSHYFYNRYKLGDHYRIQEDLPTFVRSPRAVRLANASILQLTEHSVDDVLARPRECASTAIANLEKFALVGCLERLDVFTSQFEARYRRTLAVPRRRRNPAPRSLQATQITDALREQVQQMCRADMEVYQYALSRCAVS